MLEVRLLGKFAVTVDGHPVDLPLRAAQSLLAYLALSAGTPHRREQLAGLLWPDADEASAKGNLRHTLWRLRKALGSPEVILADDLTLMLDPAAGYWLDAQWVGRKLPPGASAEDLLAAVAAYGGELLPGFYDEWVLLERERLQAAFEHKMEALLECLLSAQRWADALEWGERWIALGHTPEAAYRALIVAHGNRGDAAAAATTYRRCLEALQADLGVEPSTQTRAAYARWAQAGSLTPVSAARTVRGYELQDRIGGGAFGVVYRAYQPAVQRQVAIKVIAPQHASRPGFIRRFEAEARLIAQLEHPHIVPLFDYWRDPKGAYLVMRLLPRSLRAALGPGPFSPEATVPVVEQIASALAVAHRHGIAHLDLKPDNILLDDDGQAYLADFGIARSLSETPMEDEGVSGSLEYISPEQLKGEAVTPHADLYGLGLVLYEMVAGRHPFSGQTPSDLIASHLQTPLPDLRTLRQDLPEGLNRVVQRATAKDPADRYADVLALAADWRQAVLGEAAPAASAPAEIDVFPVPNPYKGLRAFEEADAADFFGREALVQRLVSRLGEGEPGGRFLALIGASGSGKSSVVKAGLIPALRQGAVPGSAQWFIATLTPGEHPLASLAAALLSVAAHPPAFLLEQLQTNARGLVWAADRVLAGVTGDLLLVVDQFEELHTLTAAEAERAQFLTLLHAAVAEPRSRVRVLILLRADFTDRPLQYPEFGELMRAHTEFVLPLSADALGRAVTGPARRAGVTVEADLLAALVGDVNEQPGALPMLQYALTETFDHAGSRPLTLDAYHAIGGLSGALARRADEILASLDAAGQAQAQQMFLRLVTLGEGVEDTRRRVLRSELEALTPNPSPTARRESAPAANPYPLAPILDAFGRARLLYFDRDPATRGPTVEVAHEALLREWPRLRDWLSDSRDEVRLQRQLAAAALDWRNANREASFLLSGARLAQFEGWAAEAQVALTQDERAFIAASLAERQAQHAAEEARRRHELETAQKLAETEKRRAEEQSRNAGRLRQRAVYLVGALAAALVLLVATLGLAQLSNRNLTAARAANTQAVAEVQNRSTAEAQAQEQKIMALGAQATAQAEAFNRATAEAQAQADKNTAQSEARVRATAEALAQEQRQAAVAAEQQAISNLALSEAQRLAAESKTLILEGRDASAAALLALRSVGLHYTPQGDEALSQALFLDYPTQVYTGYAALLWGGGFLPGHALFFTTSSDNQGSVRLRKITTGEIVRAFDVPNGCFELRLSPNGKFIAAACHDGFTHVWNIDTGQAVLHIEHQASENPRVRFSPDGTQLLTGGVGAVAKLWDFETGQLIREFVPPHTTSPVAMAAAFTPDGRQIVTGGQDNLLRLWDVATGTQLRTFVGHTDWAWGVDISPDGKYLVSSSMDSGGARLWDLATGQELRRFVQGNTMMSCEVAFSPDGRYVFTGGWDTTARIWDVQTGREMWRFNHPQTALGMAFSTDGQYALTTAWDNVARLWELHPGAGLPRYATLASPAFGALSPNGRQLAVSSADNVVRLWETQTGQELRRFTGHTGMIFDIAFSPDGRRLATTSSSDGLTNVWETQSGQALWTNSDGGQSVAFSADGQKLMVVDSGPSASLYDAGTGRRLQSFGYTENMLFGAYAPNNATMAASLAAREDVLLWDTTTGKVLRAFHADPGDVIKAVVYSPDSQYLAGGGNAGTLYLWDVATGQEIRRFVGHTNMIERGLAFSPDGRYLASGGYDRTARLWEVGTGQEVRRLAGYADGVAKVAFTPDGRRLLTISYDGAVKLTYARLQEAVDDLCRRQLRDFSPDERRRYNITDTRPTCPGLVATDAAQP